MPLVATGKQLLDMETILHDQVELGAGQKVADFGCGNGYNTLIAAQIVGGKGQAYAVDILKTTLQTVQSEARRLNITNVKTVWSDIEMIGATKIAEQSLDFGLVVHTIYQVKDKLSFFKEVSRLIKPDGKVVIIDWTVEKSPVGPPLDHRVSEEEVRTVLQQVPDLQEAEGFNPGNYHYGLVYTKLG